MLVVGIVLVLGSCFVYVVCCCGCCGWWCLLLFLLFVVAAVLTVVIVVVYWSLLIFDAVVVLSGLPLAQDSLAANELSWLYCSAGLERTALCVACRRHRALLRPVRCWSVVALWPEPLHAASVTSAV